MSYSTFLFDLDGTVIDSVGLILRSYHHSAETHMNERFDDQVWLDRLGQPLRIQFQAVTDDPTLIESMVETYRGYYLREQDASVKAFPSMAETVRSLHASRVRLGVVTSKMRRGTERALRLVGLEDCFEVVVTAEDVDNAKPHPEPVVKALSLLDSEPADTVFIGDSPHDLASGRAAGVHTAAVLWGPFDSDFLRSREPTHLLERPGEILALRKSL